MAAPKDNGKSSSVLSLDEDSSGARDESGCSMSATESVCEEQATGLKGVGRCSQSLRSQGMLATACNLIWPYLSN